MSLSLGSATIVIDGNTEGLKSSLDKAKALIADGLGDAQRISSDFGKGIKDSLVNAVDGVSGFIDNFSDIKIQATTALKAVGSAVNILPEGFENLKSKAGSSIALITESIGGLNLSFSDLLSPIGLIQTSVGVLTSLAVSNFDVIIDYITEWTNSFIDLYNQSFFVRSQIEAIGLVFKTLFKIVKLVVTTAIDGFSTIGKVIKAAINGDLSDIPDLIKGYFKQAAADTLDTGAAIGEDVGEAINSALFNRLDNVSRDDVSGFIDKLKGFGIEAGESIVKGVGKAISDSKELIASVASIGTLSIGGVTPEANYSGQFEFLKGIQEELRISTELQKAFGNSFDVVAEKTKILQEGISSLIENGFKAGSTEVQYLKDQLVGLAETAIISSQQMTSITQEAFATFANDIAGVLTNASSLSGVLSSLGQSIAKTMANILSAVGDAAIKTGIAMEAVQKAISFGGSGIAAIAAGLALKVFSGSIQNLFADAPKLAKGGLVFGETLAVVGDNPNASVDPEVIAPLSKLKGYLDNSGGGSQTLRAVVSGSDLILVSERAAITDNIITGR